MNDEIEPIFIGEVDDIDIGSVENFEHEDVNYAIYRIESGFFATEGNCRCAERSLLSEQVSKPKNLNAHLVEISLVLSLEILLQI